MKVRSSIIKTDALVKIGSLHCVGMVAAIRAGREPQEGRIYGINGVSPAILESGGGVVSVACF